MLDALREKNKYEKSNRKKKSEGHRAETPHDKKVKKELEGIIHNSEKFSISCIEIIKPIVIQISNPVNFFKMMVKFGNKLSKQRRNILEELKNIQMRSGVNEPKEHYRVLELRKKHAAALCVIDGILEISNNSVQKILMSCKVSEKKKIIF